MRARPLCFFIALSSLLAFAGGQPGGGAHPDPTADWFDVDADGLADLHLAAPGGGQRLLRNQGDGGFEDVTERCGLASLGSALDVAWGDLDEDGLPDLLLVDAVGRPRLFRAVRAWSFEERFDEVGLRGLENLTAASLVDYDGDGALDAQLTGLGGLPVLLHGSGRGSFERVELPAMPVAAPVLDRSVEPGADEGAASREDASPKEMEAAGRPRGNRTGPTPGTPGVASTRSPAPVVGTAVDPGSFSGSPSASYSSVCAGSVTDQAQLGTCLNASSDPVLGMLYPQTVHLNVDANGNVGIGTVGPLSTLHVQGAGWLGGAGRFESVDQENAVQIVGSNVGGTVNIARLELLDSDDPSNSGYLAITGSTGDTAGDMRFVTGGITGPTAGERLRITKAGRVGIGTSTPSSLLDVEGDVEAGNYYLWDGTADAAGTVGFDSANGPAIQFWGNDTSQAGRMFMLSAGLPRMTVTNDGKVGIGTSVPFGMLDVEGEIHLSEAGSGHRLISSVGGSALDLFSVGAPLYVNNGDGTNEAIYLMGSAVGVGTDAPEAKLHVSAPTTLAAGRFVMTDFFGTSTGPVVHVIKDNAAAPSESPLLRVEHDWAPDTIVLDVWTPNSGAEVRVAGELGVTSNGSDATLRIEQDGGGNLASGYNAGGSQPVFEVRNSGRVVTTALRITGGGDLVEGFETGECACPPGTVVSIDPARPGALRPSSAAYDPKVAGVVSGAGGVSHGIRMGQEGELGGDTLLAMAGRVYVQCSAENGPIVPGDRLTTAAAPGRAMKATDPARTPGAVIGKAMTALEDGRGLVLVLVDLQ